MGARSATPLLPFGPILNSRLSSKSVYSLSEMSQVPRGSLPWRTPSSSTFQVAPSAASLLISFHSETRQPLGTPLLGNSVTGFDLSVASALSGRSAGAAEITSAAKMDRSRVRMANSFRAAAAGCNMVAQAFLPVFLFYLGVSSGRLG